MAKGGNYIIERTSAGKKLDNEDNKEERKKKEDGYKNDSGLYFGLGNYLRKTRFLER